MNAQKFLIYTKLMRKFGNSDEKHTREYLKFCIYLVRQN